MATLKIENEELKSSRKVSSKYILKLKQIKFYFGGIPPDYYFQCNFTKKLLHTHNSLLGDIQNVNGNGRSYSLYDNGDHKRHYGVTLTTDNVSSIKTNFLRF